jgi:type I restriction enzyme, S subunit
VTATIQLRHLTSEACDGPFGSAIKTEHYSDSGARVVRLGNIGAAEWFDHDAAYLDLEYFAQLRRHAVEPGDLLIAGLGDDRNPVGRAAVAPDHLGPAMVKADCFRFRLIGASPRFIAYFLSSSAGFAQSAQLADGSTRQRLSLGKALSLRVPNLPLTEQRAIADYLDAETARVDALIAKKQQLTDLIDQRLEAKIDLLCSGVTAVLRRVVERFVDYRGATPEKTDVGVPLITATHIKNGTVDHTLDPIFVSASTYVTWMRRGMPRRGDVLMTMEAPLGEIAQVQDERIALAQRVMLIKTIDELCSADYLAFALRSTRMQQSFRSHSTGSTAAGIKADRLKGLHVPMPPRLHQRQIVRELQSAERTARQTTGLLTQQIDLLRERRQALIASAVTGQHRVPGVA